MTWLTGVWPVASAAAGASVDVEEVRVRLRTERKRQASEEVSPPTAAAPGPESRGPVHPSLTRVLLGIRDMALHQEVMDFLSRESGVDLTGAVTDAEALEDRLRSVPVDAVVTCPDLAVAAASAPQDASAGAEPQLFVVAEDLTIPVLRLAIDAGAQGVHRWPEERIALRDRLRRRRIATTPMRRGRIVAILGSRGGAGTTFLSTQLAASFAGRGVPTAIADLDMVCSDLTAALGVPADHPVRTIADLLPVADELTGDHLEQVLFRHPAGFAALLAPTPDQELAGWRREPGRAIVAQLAATHAMVILHLPRTNDVVTRAMVELADPVLLVTTLDLFSLFGAKRVVRSFGLEARPERCQLVIGRSSRSELTADDVRRLLGMEPAARIRTDPAVVRAQARGELLSRRSGRAARDVDDLARTLLEGVAGQVERS
jgi:Flp pilus assembly CpaE family ATPase